MLSLRHFTGPVRRILPDLLHPKHSVQCVGGDAVTERRISSSLSFVVEIIIEAGYIPCASSEMCNAEDWEIGMGVHLVQ
jgi:hypothetical protein